jgi:hypothetical protein
MIVCQHQIDENIEKVRNVVDKLNIVMEAVCTVESHNLAAHLWYHPKYSGN